MLVGVVVWIPSSLGVWYLSGIVRSGAEEEANDEDVDHPPVSSQRKQEGQVHSSTFIETKREKAENGKKQRWWVGWIGVASILLAASIVTNAVVITRQ